MGGSLRTRSTLHCLRARFRKGICGPEFVVRWPFSRVRLPLNRSEIARVSYFTHAVGNRRLFAIFSQPILVRWLSGRKQRFAKAPYLSKGTEGSIPSLTATLCLLFGVRCLILSSTRAH